MRLKSWKAPALILVILSVVILSVLYVVVPAQGTFYEGDWCSFKAPDGCIVTFESDGKVILEKLVSPDPELRMELVVDRFEFEDRIRFEEYEDWTSSDEELRWDLEHFRGFDEVYLQGEGIIGECTYSEGLFPEVIDGSQGRTATDLRWYEHPNAKILIYEWAEGNDTVRITLRWLGLQALYLDTDDTIEPLNDAYDTFEYYG